MKNISFLFGAGADCAFNYPLGDKFIEEVLRNYYIDYEKHSKMFSFNHYNDKAKPLKINKKKMKILIEYRNSDKYHERFAYFLYLVNAHLISDNINENIIIEYYNSNEFIKRLSNVKLSIKGIDKDSFSLVNMYFTRNQERRKFLVNMIINPNKSYAIEFIWEYFMNYLSKNDLLLDLMVDYMKKSDMNYFVLADIANDLMKNYKTKQNKNNLYKFTEKYIAESGYILQYIATTNYTPKVKKYFEEANYLHGELDKYYNFHKFDFTPSKEEGDYPYLILQTSVKIQDDVMIANKYLEFYDNLLYSNYLFVIGLNFCEDDNHLMHLLKKACMANPRLKIIHCCYKLSESEDKYNNLSNKILYYPNFELVDFSIETNGVNDYIKFTDFMDTHII